MARKSFLFNDVQVLAYKETLDANALRRKKHILGFTYLAIIHKQSIIKRSMNKP